MTMNRQLVIGDRRQNKLVYLITKETRKSPEQLMCIVEKREHFDNWLTNVEKLSTEEMSESYCNFHLYNKHTTKDGVTYRLIPYQLCNYVPYEYEPE